WGRSGRDHRHPGLRGVPLGVHLRGSDGVRGGLRGAHFPAAVRDHAPHEALHRRAAGAPRRGHVSARDKPRLVEEALSHLFLAFAVVFALYPVLWVVTLAFSGSRPPSPNVLPVPNDPTASHLLAVLGTTRQTADGSMWLFGRQLMNSLVVSLATAV